MTATSTTDLLDAFVDILERDGGLTERDKEEIAEIEKQMVKLEKKELI